MGESGYTEPALAQRQARDAASMRAHRAGSSPFRGFRRNEDGAVAIEAVVWTPAILAIILLAFDIGITFFGFTRMWEAARLTARAAAVRNLTPAEAETYARSILPGNATFTVNVDDSDPDNIVVSITGSNLSPFFGFVELFTPQDVSAWYAMEKSDL